MVHRLLALVTSLVVLAAARPAIGASPPGDVPKAPAFTDEQLTAALAASVFLADRACSGVVVGSPRVVATAAHCLPKDGDSAMVRFSDGQSQQAKVHWVDVERDLALLVAPEASTVTPLRVSASLPKLREPLLFLGRPDRAQARHAVVDRLGPCPSLPKLPAAAFTDLSAVPGDSGAPLVDSRGRVVALVHGGARCHIAVPAHPLWRVIAALPADVRAARPAPGGSRVVPPVAGPAAVAGDTATEARRIGPIVVERTNEGFRFRFSFSFGDR